jgi:REP-associated tyrosine transposase
MRGLQGVPESIGGVEDHVHLLVGLRATHTLADFVRELKKPRPLGFGTNA